MAVLYEPQCEQLGVSLVEREGMIAGALDASKGEGAIWVVPVGPHCHFIEHHVRLRESTWIRELSTRPYAGVCSMNQASQQNASRLAFDQGVNSWHANRRSGDVFTIAQESAGALESMLEAGRWYSSQSILFEEEFFFELDQGLSTHAGSCASISDEWFDEVWQDGASHDVQAAFSQLSLDRLLACGPQRVANAVVMELVDRLFARSQVAWRASGPVGALSSARLAAHAAALVEREVACGHAPSLDQLASRLYTSRSWLCAVFKRERGEPLGAFVRRVRARAAEELLSDRRLSIAQVSERLGYASQAAFSQAFRTTHGISPSQWRKGA